MDRIAHHHPNAAVRAVRNRISPGVLLCVVAAAAFSTMPIFTKAAYAAGVGVVGLVAGRTIIAAALFWFLHARSRLPLPARPALVRALLLGMIGSSVQLGLFAGGLQRLDAAPASLLFYTYPAMVMVGAVLLGREQVGRTRVLGLIAALFGVSLVLSGARGAAWDGFGVMLVLSAAMTYAVWLLSAHALLKESAPLVLATLTATGAALVWAAVGLLSGRMEVGFGPSGWAAILGLAVVSTVLGGLANYGGLARVGPTTNSIVLTAEPPLTLGLAALLLGERLSWAQGVGVLLVVATVVLLQHPFEVRRDRDHAS